MLRTKAPAVGDLVEFKYGTHALDGTYVGGLLGTVREVDGTILRVSHTSNRDILVLVTQVTVMYRSTLRGGI